MVVDVSKNGMVYRQDDEFGLLVYSPYTGLVYAVAPEHSGATSEWLDSGNARPSDGLPTAVASALSFGWDAPGSRPPQTTERLLPASDCWSSLPTPTRPILINWLLSPSCPFNCVYCYARDLMTDAYVEGSKQVDVGAVAKTILAHEPLAVVLTGGEPTLSPQLTDAVAALLGKTGLILDTNGWGLTDEIIALLSKNRVNVRVSLDDEIPRLNTTSRGGKAIEVAVDAICRCVDAGIPVTVQTVATRWNLASLAEMGHKLHRMGVRVWRILKVVNSSASEAGFRQASAIDDKGKGIERQYDHALRQIAVQSRVWSGSMLVENTRGGARNSVALVAPDGTWRTESNSHLEKVLVDEDSPRDPSLSAIVRRIDMPEHRRRYLGM